MYPHFAYLPFLIAILVVAIALSYSLSNTGNRTGTYSQDGFEHIKVAFVIVRQEGDA